MSQIEQAYAIAKERYAALGVDTDRAVERAAQIPLSIHCWQGDDVNGFEEREGGLTGGCAVTGSYPGRARNVWELRQDAEMAFSLIPGPKRFALHAIYYDTDQPVERNEIRPEHFARWADWAKDQKISLDFNPTYFAHAKSDPYTLSAPDAGLRAFWIEHGIACRKIGEFLGRSQGNPCVNNIWVADGFKDNYIDRYGFRARLKESLDQILKEPIDPAYNLDSVESKLFGLGAESGSVGSHEFYMGYAMENRDKPLLVTLDTGHFHPTELVSDKISSMMLFLDQMMLHVSRPVRWDSDHVVTYTEELVNIAQEIVRNDLTKRVHIGMDFFDGSINRVAAWAIGTRNMAKALLTALLEPTEHLKQVELSGDFTARLAALEELKTFPIGAVWDYYCERNNVPAGTRWLPEVRNYEKKVLAERK